MKKARDTISQPRDCARPDRVQAEADQYQRIGGGGENTVYARGELAWAHARAQAAKQAAKASGKQSGKQSGGSKHKGSKQSGGKKGKKEGGRKKGNVEGGRLTSS